jgi:hypothetical protein
MGTDPSPVPSRPASEPGDASISDTAEIAGLETHVDFQPARLPQYVPDSSTLLELSHSRSCQQALELVVDCLFESMKAHEKRDIPFCRHGGPSISITRPQQFGDVLYIPPGQGKLLVMSDLEGHFEALEALFSDKEHDLLTLMARGQAQCIFLGDLIDREGGRGSQIYEFLLDLKCKRGFYDTIHILAGNHELTPDSIQACPEQGGFFSEVIQHRRSYSDLGDLKSELAQNAIAWHQAVFPGETSENIPQLRIALWRLYNHLFSQFPKVVLTGNGAVLCHAGPTDQGPFEYIREPATFSPPTFAHAVAWLAGPKFTAEDLNEEQMAKLVEHHKMGVLDQTWSDYSSVCQTTRILPNHYRKQGLLFGLEALQSYLDILGKQVMIRGHQVPTPRRPLGPEARVLSPNTWTAGDRLITINSVRTNGKFVETDSGFEEQNSFQYLEVPLDRPIRSVDDIRYCDL